MTNEVKPMVANNWFTGLFISFRSFSFSKLFNAGLFASKRETIHGAKYNAVKDENGNWIAGIDAIEISGFWQNVSSMIQTVFSNDEQSVKDVWNKFSFNQKFLFMRGLMRLTMAGVLLTFIKGMGDDDDDYRYKWMWSDFMDAWVVVDFVQSPIPAFRFLKDLWSTATLQEEIGLMTKYIPGYGNVRSLSNIIERIQEDPDRSQFDFENLKPETVYGEDEE